MESSEIQKLANDILNFTNARSVFLYGSRARDDFYGESDYEVGVLMERSKYLGRSTIKENLQIKEVNIFPFYYEDFLAGDPDTPFVKSIYMREIIEAGKTLAGEKVIENMKSPAITLLDILADVRFNLGYSLAATHSYRNGDNATASLHLSKSCLFGTRDYVIFKVGKLPTTYSGILQELKNLDLGEYSELPAYAYKLRRREVQLNERDLFENISYLNKFIEPILLNEFWKSGNITCIDPSN